MFQEILKKYKSNSMVDFFSSLNGCFEPKLEVNTSVTLFQV